MDAIENLLLHDKVNIEICTYVDTNFDITDYMGKYSSVHICMHCHTEKEASIFMNYLDSIGRTWHSGDSYLNKNNYHEYEENTIYYFLAGTYGHIGYRSSDTTVLEFSDFDWS